MKYRFIQTEENGKWIPLEDNQQFLATALQMGAVRMTVLSVNQNPDDADDPDDTGYDGPFYGDIDSKDLRIAIASCQELVNKLIELDVPVEGIMIYCSGSKGFHVFVPNSVFKNSNRTVKRLPSIYMEMARDLYVTGLDFQVYSAGKGRMFRPENGLRPDGKYRVRITIEELFSMTVELYHELVSKPRTLSLPGPNGHKAPALAMMYERARLRVQRKQVLRGTALPIDQLIPYAEEPPRCVEMVCKSELKSSVSFNQAGLQLAAFIARSGMPDYKAASLITEMADTGHSTKYSTPRLRATHLQGLAHYAKAKTSVYFSCSGMRAVTHDNPCRDCPLQSTNLDGSTEEETQAVEARPDGYYAYSANGVPRKISTFTLQPVEVFMDQTDSSSIPRRIGTQMEIYSNFECKGVVYFDEIGWRSKQEFLKQFEGIAGLGFIGNDIDIQKIKITVYIATEENDVEEVTNVYAAGIYKAKAGANTVYTYVEPGLSINNYGIQGTHMIQAKVTPAPVMRKTTKIEPGDKGVEEAVRTMMGINCPEAMAHMIGWHTLCHLKAHIMPMHKQFPSLNLWGEAGCGKSMTSSVMSLLNGVDYIEGGDPLMVSTTSAYPLINLASSTTTIPRIMEEFNKSQIKKYGIYEMATEIIKAAWNGYPVPRGSIGRKSGNDSRVNAHVEELHVSAPLVVCSEQAPDKPALKQRMIQLHLTRKGREGRTDFYQQTVANKNKILSFSRALTMMALKTKPDWINTQLAESYKYVPEGINDRSRFSYAMLFVGLDFFHAVAHSLLLDLNECGMVQLKLPF